MHNTFFTSDTHFAHKNIIEYDKRPFTTIEEHDQALINNWNSVVKNTDQVYHLGDFGWNPDALQYLNGQIFLIKGNHDKNPITRHKRFGFVKDVYRIPTKRFGIGIFLSHYSHRSWAKMGYGEIHLFGHSHGMLPDYGRSTDVGVVCWNYTPVHVDVILDKMKKIDIVADHDARFVR